MLNNEWEYDEPIDDDEEIIDKRNFIDEDGNDIFKKKSEDKTVEERIKTSRSLKIKHNKWNQIDYTEDFGEEKITINPGFYQSSTSFENIEFEKKFHNIILNSKYKEILLGKEKVTINYQIVNDIIIYCYARLKNENTLTTLFVLVCEYCGIGLKSMFKRLSSYLQMQILTELSEVSKLPKEIIDNEYKFW